MLYQRREARAADRKLGRGAARAPAIRAIVADADAAFGAESLWPANEWDSWRTPTPLKTLYVGAAGVIWALDELRAAGTRSRGRTSPPRRSETVAAWRREPDLMAEIELPSTEGVRPALGRDRDPPRRVRR